MGHSILLNQINPSCPKMYQEGIFTISAKLYEINNDTTLYAHMEISNYANLTFTVDTGAMSSLIKSDIVRKGIKVQRDNTEFFGLIKNQLVKSIGKIHTHININNSTFEHTFFIINDDINL